MTGAPRHTGHVALVGPTATGKSDVAMAVARRDPGVEIVVVDSMQVYRGMDIGTAKPSAADRADAPHHLLDLVDPSEEFTVADFQDAWRLVRAEIEERGHRALLVGGTGLYLRAAVDGLELAGRFPEVVAELDAEPDTAALHRRLVEVDPVAAGRMEPTNRRRVIRALEVTLGSDRPFSSFGSGLDRYSATGAVVQVGLDRAQPDLAARIAARYQAQLDAGFVDEVASLARRPLGLGRTARQALGYREILAHLSGDLGLEEAIDLAIRRTRQFARRQRRWFRRDPRITWLEPGGNAVDAVARLLKT